MTSPTVPVLAAEAITSAGTGQLVLAAVLGIAAPAGLALHRLWTSVPQSNRDFEWLEG